MPIAWPTRRSVQAAACSNEVRAAELRGIAENCRVVPENPPQTFAQAVQMVWFVHVMFHIDVCTTACGFGRFDQYMWPFYKKDVIDEGILTRDEALELVECLYLKACEVYEVRDTWYATAFAGYPMWQILVVGGMKRDGSERATICRFCACSSRRFANHAARHGVARM